MNSLEYKKALNDFGKDVQDVCEDLYEAVSEGVSAAKRKKVLAAGLGKLKEYDALLARFDANEKKNAEERFGDDVELIRERVTKLSGK